MVIQYKCPNCGADMVFDSKSGTLSCGSCGRKDKIEDFPPENKISSEKSHTESKSSSFQQSDAKQYACNNCGAVLITDTDTTATICSFCGSPMILSDRLSGTLAPAQIIPFTISKEQATDAFKKWCKKGFLTPSDFKYADRIKSLTGLYVPYWLYDLNCLGEVTAECTRSHTFPQGDYIVTKTDHFHVVRSADLNYLKVPADASEKLNDDLMDLLEPFNYTDLKPFKTPYLSGYLAEKYNYTETDLFPRIKERVGHYVQEFMNSTIQGYSTKRILNEQIQVSPRNSVYTLLPVWIVCYDYENSEHNFVMNGQTGKIVGTSPISAAKVIGLFTGITLSTFILIKLIIFLLGGGL